MRRDRIKRKREYGENWKRSKQRKKSRKNIGTELMKGIKRKTRRQ